MHTVASLLKLYLRELPEPVIPFARYEDFLSCAQLLTKDEGEVSASRDTSWGWAWEGGSRLVESRFNNGTWVLTARLLCGGRRAPNAVESV